ncbi:MAG: hypothetical protein AAFV25_12095, partial [Bacteroidota bacterium]
MNKKAIWIIIGLMGAALIGSVLLQMYWIRWSIQLNEAQFDKNVFNALNKVSERLQSAEKEKEDMEAFYHVRDLPNLAISQEFYQTTTENGVEIAMRTSVNSAVKADSIFREKYRIQRDKDKDCDDPKCRNRRLEEYRRMEKYWERQQLNKWLNPPPITNRINLQYLNNFIQQE